MFQTITANRTGSYRREHLSGRTYLVTSVRMIVPGVLTGNRGALLYPPEEIKKSVSAWNGMPIVVNHPKEGQRFISARNPKVLASVGVGFVFNASMESGNLDAEAWIDEAKIAEVSPELLSKIKKNEPVEVSTGLGTENQPRKGNFNGKDFDHVARNYAPDHLALLPSEKGACSLEDGCGLAVNKKDYHKWVRAYDKSGSNKSFSIWSRTANVEESAEDCHCKGKCDECKDKGTVNFQPTNNARVRNSMSWTFQPTTNAEGVWRTTDDGSRIFIKDGEAYAGGPGGPKIGGKAKGGSKSSKSKTTPVAKTSTEKKSSDTEDFFDQNVRATGVKRGDKVKLGTSMIGVPLKLQGATGIVTAYDEYNETVTLKLDKDGKSVEMDHRDVYKSKAKDVLGSVLEKQIPIGYDPGKFVDYDNTSKLSEDKIHKALVEDGYFLSERNPMGNQQKGFYYKSGKVNPYFTETAEMHYDDKGKVKFVTKSKRKSLD